MRRPALDRAADTGAADQGGTRRHPSPFAGLPPISLKNPLDLLRAGIKLTTLEIEDLREPLIDGILAFSEEADKLISRTNRDRAEAEIWSTITREDAATIAEPLLALGAKQAQFAFVVRQIVRTHTLLRIGLITLPRFYETFAFYAQHGGFLLWSPPPVSTIPAAS